MIVEAGDLHLPLDKPVKMLLRSIDVLHDFYVPQFRAKMDMVPGMITYFWFTPTRTGEFEVLCAELCGVGHAFMRGYVYVDSEADYQAWLDEQLTFAELAQPTRLGSAAPQAGRNDRSAGDRNERSGRRKRWSTCPTWRTKALRPAEVPDVAPSASDQLVGQVRLLPGREDTSPCNTPPRRSASAWSRWCCRG